jgi:hypothetical protein
LDVLRVLEQLWKASGAAADCEVSAVRDGELRTLEEYVLYSLKGLAALASYLFWCVLREEAFCVFASEGMPCDETVERWMR